MASSNETGTAVSDPPVIQTYASQLDERPWALTDLARNAFLDWDTEVETYLPIVPCDTDNVGGECVLDARTWPCCETRSSPRHCTLVALFLTPATDNAVLQNAMGDNDALFETLITLRDPKRLVDGRQQGRGRLIAACRVYRLAWWSKVIPKLAETSSHLPNFISVTESCTYEFRVFLWSLLDASANLKKAVTDNSNNIVPGITFPWHECGRDIGDFVLVESIVDNRHYCRIQDLEHMAGAQQDLVYRAIDELAAIQVSGRVDV